MKIAKMYAIDHKMTALSIFSKICQKSVSLPIIFQLHNNIYLILLMCLIQVKENQVVTNLVFALR